MKIILRGVIPLEREGGGGEREGGGTVPRRHCFSECNYKLIARQSFPARKA